MLMKWETTHNWCDEIESSFINNTETCRLHNLINNDKIRWVNSTLGTVGMAAYIDSPCSDKISQSNTYMLNRYDIYDQLATHLTHRLKCKCVYPYLKYNLPIGVPGFHIFDADSWLGKGYHVASLHTDQQEKRVPWPDNEQFDWTKTISFTIPITTPEQCGLYIIQRGPEAIKPGIPLWWTLRDAPTQYIPYKLGNCYVHHGKWYHMISPFNGKYGDRVTLQGHALYCISKKEYWLYW